MKAKSIKGNSSEEIKLSLEQSMVDGFKPTLAFVFLSIRQDIDAVCEVLDQQGISIFGATSCGEFIDGVIGDGTIAILLLDMKRTDFTILSESYEERAPEEVARDMGNAALRIYENPSFLISISMHISESFIDGKAVLHALEGAAGNHINIWGGNAGDDKIYDQTLVFTNQKSLKKGIILLVLDSKKILMKGQAASGWKASGTEKTITKSIGSSIYTIDGKPALDIVLKFLGLQLTREEAEKFTPGNVVFCLIRKEGEPVMRSSVLFNWEDRTVTLAGDIEQGDKIRFALPPDFEIVEEVTKEAEEIRNTLFPEADALLMFSCIGRLNELGPMTGIEIDGVKNKFEVPLAGFFSYGEYGRATHGKNEYHNVTCCWVALKEK